MTRRRRGFAFERHSRLKVAITAVAVAGFGAGWLGFSRAQPPIIEADVSAPSADGSPEPAVAISTPGATLTPTLASAASPAPTSSPVMPTPTAGGAALAPAPTQPPLTPTRVPATAAATTPLPQPATPTPAGATVSATTTLPAATPTRARRSRGS